MFEAVHSAAVALSAAAATAEEPFAPRELVIPELGFAAISAAFFGVLLLITYSFRAVAHRR